MSKRGCLNCHFCCRYGISTNSGDPFEKSAEPEFRTREGLDEKLKSLSRAMRAPWSIKCFSENWDAERIGIKNTDEITKAIFSNERKKCLHFAVYDKYATLEAVRDREKKKLEIIDRRITRIRANVSLAISFGALVISALANLDKISKLFIQ
jgi:hypothetical protein